MTKNDDQRYGFELVENWGDSADGWSFVEVADVCVDLRDNVFALGRGESAVQVFSPSGERTARWGQGRFIRSHSIELSPDASALFCIDCDGHTVTKFTLDGEPIFTIDSEAEPGYTGYVKDIVSSVQRAGPPFCYPTSISFGPDGDLFVTDGYGNARVHQFDSGGSLKSSWGEPGNGAGQFRLPHGILVDEEVLFVADR